MPGKRANEILTPSIGPSKKPSHYRKITYAPLPLLSFPSLIILKSVVTQTYVMNMSEDDPRRMDEIRKYAAIYGRFDCKRKPEKPLTLHEVSVNEAAAQICKHIPALLTRRDELFPLARQVVRDSGYQYSKGHSRSQCYSKTFDEDSCKRLRFDGSPGALPDHNQMEEERKKRQDRLEAVTEQIKLLAGQQHDLKTGLQQSRDTHNVVAVGQIQTQLDLLATQHYQLINEQSELSRQLRRLDRYFTEYRYGIRSSCSENDKIDTDDTDSQFSVYSYESSASIGHDANESPSHDSNMSVQTNDGYTGIKNVQGKKANSHITKQLVQETLIDEGLRVVKELANQIKDETDMNHVSLPKPEGRPRGRPPRLERDYILTTAGSTTPKHYNNDLNTNNSRNATAPVTPIQNGHSPTSVGVPLDNENTVCHNGMILSLRSSQLSEKNNVSNNSNDGNHVTSDLQDDVMSNESESSLKALLAFSQKGIKQEPSSPTSLKMD
ncbi:NGFI-A-binding protein homolog [Trichonephila inaurata madagascariensis]|uniref:NGFI-A-binding protein homolog n=1 Tax=Trichonephila inaurata madagascariensis TaxID=2747483 RepID=A0A8X6IRG5_9ARAC|nr:NGFI-A-binding protein homolog [Trichonephila inaurata madagascariensis]